MLKIQLNFSPIVASAQVTLLMYNDKLIRGDWGG